LRRSAAPATPRPLITSVIFDLDDTLYDCYGQRVCAAHFRASQAMAEAGVPASAEDIFRARMQAYESDPQLTHIDAEVCRRFGISEPEKIIRIARHAFFTLPVDKLTLFPGSRRVLRTLHRCGVKVFIATFGDPEIQRDKVAALGLDREPAVQRIFYADTNKLVTKEAVFRGILRNAERDPWHVLVVGDRPSSEIRAGRELGMHTVRVQAGEFRALEPQGLDEEADYEIVSIEAILKLPFQFGE
jgi:FMN phosphatase YigB (HAD superfamily)